jgi:carboxyl-terminal processing protease
VVLLALLLITFLGGWFGNQLYANSFNPSNQSQAYSNLFQQAWSIVDQHYVDRKAVDYKQMSYKAIQSMLDVLHDKGHTRFLTPQDVQAENQQLSGTFTGVGIYLHQDPKTKQLIITSPIPGSPAEKAGLKHGDIITAINNVSTAGKDIPSVSTLIQGKAGTSVTITVQRPSTGQTLKIPVVRAQITVPNVLMHYIAEDHIADIQLVQFASGVSNQLRDAIQQAKKLGAHKIILDLRENPGGYLSEAVDTASEFMKTGNVLLEQDSSGNRTPYAVTGSTIDTSDPIAVLVNGDTASAAEIVSGALQDNKRAILIGEKTFGTGTVLEEYPLSDGSAILLGTHEWLTPNGSFIRDNGIHPNIEVKLPANANILTPNDENAGKMNEQQILAGGDNQLVAAIHYLEKH